MEESTRQEKPKANLKSLYIVGTQIGNCPICKETKKLLLLRFGLTLCDECLLICINILEQLQYGVIENETKKPLKNTTPHRRISTRIKTDMPQKLKIPKTIRKQEAK